MTLARAIEDLRQTTATLAGELRKIDPQNPALYDLGEAERHFILAASAPYIGHPGPLFPARTRPLG